MPQPPSLDLDLVKRPHSKTNYSEEQLLELIQCMDDPLYFMRTFMRVQHPTRGALAFEPFGFQEEMVASFEAHRFNIVMTARQMGKALCLYTPIPTPTGWTTMGAIKVGDEILGDDGSPVRVSFATDVMHGHDCYEVEFDNGEIITADAEHLWLLDGEALGKPTVLTTKQAREFSTLEAVSQDGQRRFLITAIRCTASVPVRCIQVDNESHLFLCGRSMIPTHNTTVAAAYLLWKAMFTPDFTILVCANKFEQAMEIMQRVRYAYENIPDHIRAGAAEFNKTSIKFDNGSRIVSRATTKDSGRGLSISLLYVDEFAFVPPNKAKEFWTSIRPTLATGGNCIITSTPQNDEDQFAMIWKGAIKNTDEFGNPTNNGLGINGFKSLCYPWHYHPERDEKWAIEEEASLGKAKFRQEHNCVVGDTRVTVRDRAGRVFVVTVQQLECMMAGGS